MGAKLAKRILETYPDHNIDVVIPIPDTARTSALQCAYKLNKPFREGFIKNRYIARTFIMPGQATRKKTVRLKLNTIRSEFEGKNVLLVDDSIVRGTTSTELVKMAREAGAASVYLTSAAPPVRYPNVYGIDIPTATELVAHNRTSAQVAEKTGADWVLYQELGDLVEAVQEVNPAIMRFDSSCFSGEYVTGDITRDYLDDLHLNRNDKTISLRMLSISSRCGPFLPCTHWLYFRGGMWFVVEELFCLLVCLLWLLLLWLCSALEEVIVEGEECLLCFIL
ncbi:unnamed protein product [Choristocarpus tenellus]